MKERNTKKALVYGAALMTAMAMVSMTLVIKDMSLDDALIVIGVGILGFFLGRGLESISQ